MAKKALPTFQAEAESEAVRKRRQHMAVRRYLEALARRQGATVKPDQLKKRLDVVEQQLLLAAPIARVQLIQERIAIRAELDGSTGEMEAETFFALEQDFVNEAFDWAQRKGISYQALREAGVPASVLREAGIPRGSYVAP